MAVRFAEDLRRLMNDLFVNENGRPVMKLEAARALKDIIIGMFMDELKYFPIPNISGRDANMEWYMPPTPSSFSLSHLPRCFVLLSAVALMYRNRAISDINMTLFDLLPEDISIEQAAGTHFLPKTIGSAAPSTVVRLMFSSSLHDTLAYSNVLSACLPVCAHSDDHWCRAPRDTSS